jgi:hypothetical protein
MSQARLAGVQVDTFTAGGQGGMISNRPKHDPVSARVTQVERIPTKPTTRKNRNGSGSSHSCTHLNRS